MPTKCPCATLPTARTTKSSSEQKCRSHVDATATKGRTSRRPLWLIHYITPFDAAAKLSRDQHLVISSVQKGGGARRATTPAHAGDGEVAMLRPFQMFRRPAHALWDVNSADAFLWFGKETCLKGWGEPGRCKRDVVLFVWRTGQLLEREPEREESPA